MHRSSYNYWAKRPKAIKPERLKLIAGLKRWLSLNNGSAGQRTLVSLLTTSGYQVSRWLVSKLMKQEGLVSRQWPSHKYAKAEKAHLAIPNLLDRQFSPTKPNITLKAKIGIKIQIENL